jgi:hypothetical protein
MILLDERGLLASELEQKGFGLYDFYDQYQRLELEAFCALSLNRRSEVLLVDVATILNKPHLKEKFQIALNTFIAAIFFYDEQNDFAKSWVEQEAPLFKKIIGAYSLPLNDVAVSMVTNQLEFVWNLLEEQKRLQMHMVKFSQELDQAFVNAELQLNKVKKVHETLVPRRSEEIKGIHFMNRYAAGEGGGGEFYDLISVSNKVYQIFLSSQSYLLSSSLIGLLNLHRQKGFDPGVFLIEARAEAEAVNQSKKKKSSPDIIIAELDVSRSELRIWGQGQGACYSSSHGLKEFQFSALQEGDHEFALKLERGEKVIVFSSGFLFNWKESNHLAPLKEFILSHQQLPLKDLLLELFIQLGQKRDSDFLTKDATVAMMEVKRHAIHQI